MGIRHVFQFKVGRRSEVFDDVESLNPQHNKGEKQDIDKLNG